VSQGAEPKLVVLRGLRINVEYPIYEGLNYIGRTEVQPVDIDLEDQEPPDRMFSSRQHACISYKDGTLIIEDLSSSNGTFVNRTRLDRGQKRTLKANDIIQIGTVQLKVKV
jgi:pSer/pThr/pTyr-binding forkhead associated (FHA) protein